MNSTPHNQQNTLINTQSIGCIIRFISRTNNMIDVYQSSRTTVRISLKIVGIRISKECIFIMHQNNMTLVCILSSSNFSLSITYSSHSFPDSQFSDVLLNNQALCYSQLHQYSKAYQCLTEAIQFSSMDLSFLFKEQITL